MKQWQVFRHDMTPYTRASYPDTFSAEGVLAAVKRDFPFVILPIVAPWHEKKRHEEKHLKAV